MDLAEYEGQKAIANVITDHAVMPLAWGYFNNDRTKSWFLTRFCHLGDRTPSVRELPPDREKAARGVSLASLADRNVWLPRHAILRTAAHDR